MARLAERRKRLVTSMMKQGIYEAAVAVLTRYGLEGTTMDRVAEQAEVAKGSLYKYFQNKVELLQFVHERLLEPLRESSQEILDEDLSALPKLEALLRHWFEYLQEHRGLFNFFFVDHAVRALLRDHDRTGRTSAVQDLALIIRQGIEEGGFRRVDVSLTAELLFGAVRDVCEQRIETDAALPIDQLIEGVMDFFQHGVGADE